MNGEEWLFLSPNKKGRLFPPSQLAELAEYWRGGTVAFMLEVESSTDDAFYSVTPQQSCEVSTPIKEKPLTQTIRRWFLK